MSNYKKSMGRDSLTSETAYSLTSKTTLVAIVAIILVSTNLRAPLTAVGPLLGVIQADTNLSAMMMGLLTALPIFAFGLFSPLAPKLAERLGIEYVLVLCMVVLTVGIILRSVDGVLALFIGTAILGMAIAIVNVLLPSLIKRDFPKQLGLMIGVYSTSMTVLAALASGISIPLAEVGLGWRGTLMCWAILSFIAFILWIPRIRGQERGGSSLATTKRVSFTMLLRSGLAWQVTLFMGIQSTGFYTVAAWLPEILHSRGLSLSAAGWLLSIIQFVSVFSMFIMPIWATRRPSQRRFVLITVIFMFFGYLGFFTQGIGLMVIASILLGLGQGACLGLSLSFFGLRSADASQAAMLSGMAQSIGYLIAAMGPISFGLLHDWTGSWTLPLISLTATTGLLLVVGLGAARDRYLSVEE